MDRSDRYISLIYQVRGGSLVAGADVYDHTVPTSLTLTGRVLLGMIARGKSTGYEIKRAIDHSTRLFWGASGGGIYPELHRLEREGLITGTGDRRAGRGRRIYSLTASGRQALADWLLEDDGPLVFDLRHEGLLRLFFASDLTHEERVRLVQRIAVRHEAVVDELETIERQFGNAGDPYALLTLEFGLGLNRWIVEWSADVAKRLSDESG